MRHVSMILVIAAMFFNSISHAFARNQVHNGKVSVILKAIRAHAVSGPLDPAHDRQCGERFGNLLGQSVTTSYNINTSTDVMSAISTFQGKVYDLNPLLIKPDYTFGAYRPHSNPSIYAVLFRIDNQFTIFSSELILYLSDQDNCEASSR